MFIWLNNEGFLINILLHLLELVLRLDGLHSFEDILLEVFGDVLLRIGDREKENLEE